MTETIQELDELIEMYFDAQHFMAKAFPDKLARIANRNEPKVQPVVENAINAWNAWWGTDEMKHPKLAERRWFRLDKAMTELRLLRAELTLQ